MKAGRELSEFGDLGVDRKLTDTNNRPWVFWSKGFNSFVVCMRDGKERIYSINGIGEIRWSLEEWNRDEESRSARDYFGVE